jgi:hypothetical protein
MAPAPPHVAQSLRHACEFRKLTQARFGLRSHGRRYEYAALHARTNFSYAFRCFHPLERRASDRAPSAVPETSPLAIPEISCHAAVILIPYDDPAPSADSRRQGGRACRTHPESGGVARSNWDSLSARGRCSHTRAPVIVANRSASGAHATASTPVRARFPGPPHPDAQSPRSDGHIAAFA